MARPHPLSRLHGLLLAGVAAAALGAGPAAAGPNGGQVKGGQAVVKTRGDVTVIRQGSRRVVIDWTSFDIGADEAVKFLQPGRNAVALNRVLDGLPTHIRGKLTANGNVWLVNPSGVYFHAGSVVDVGGLIATTADIDDDAFMAGGGDFDRPGEPGARIVNDGDITFAEAGMVGLVAPEVVNRGVIAGELGKIVVAGQESFSVDVSGDGLFEIDLKDAARTRGARAKNSGLLIAEGGTVVITAAAARDAVEAAVSVGGVVEAASARVDGGTIVLDGGAGEVVVGGRLDASGADGARGGAVDVTGRAVRLQAGSRIDVSGGTGGGRVRIGGGAHGAGPAQGGLREAQVVTMARGAAIDAGARVVGDGGAAVLWSGAATWMGGRIEARGGPLGGDGGFAEVSSAGALGYSGVADLSAPAGARGLLLLDPRDVRIVADGQGGAILAGDVLVEDAAGSDLAIEAGSLSGSLADVRIEAARDISVEAAVENRRPTVDMTLSAGRHILLGASFELRGDLSLTADAAFAERPADGIGAIRVLDGLSVASTFGALTLSAAQGIDGSTTTASDLLSLETNEALTLPDATLGGELSLRALGPATLGAVSAQELTVTAGSLAATGALAIAGETRVTAPGGAITMSDPANAFGGPVSLHGAVVEIADAGALALVSVEAEESLTAWAFGGDLDLERVRVGGAGVLVGGADGGSIRLASVEAGEVALAGAAQDVDIVGAALQSLEVAATGDLRLADATLAGGLAVDGARNVTLEGVTLGDAAAFDPGEVAGTLTLHRLHAVGDLSLSVAGDVRLGLVETTAGAGGAGDLALASRGGDVLRLPEAELDGAGTGGGFALTGPQGETAQVASPAHGVYADLLTAAGDLAISAAGDLLLPAAGGDAPLRVRVAGTAALSAGGDLALSHAGDLALAGLDAGGDAALEVVEAGALTQAGAVSVDGRLALDVAGDATLDAAGNALDTLSGRVGGTLAARDADGFAIADLRAASLSVAGQGGALSLSDVATTGDLAVEAGSLTAARLSAGGDMTFVALAGGAEAADLQADALRIEATGPLSLAWILAQSLDLASGGALSVQDGAAGATRVQAGGEARLARLRLGAAEVAAEGALEVSGVQAQSLTVESGTDVALGGLRVSGDLAVAAQGRIEDLETAPPSLGAMAVAGPRAARVGVAVDARLGDADRGRQQVALAAGDGAALSAVALDDMIAVGGEASFAAGGTIRLDGDAEAGRFARFADALSLSSGDDARVDAAGGLVLGPVDVGGALDLRAGADGAAGAGISQTAAVRVAGMARLAAGQGEARRGDVTLDLADNAFARVSLDARHATLRDADGFAVVDSQLAGRLAIGEGAAQAGAVRLRDVTAAGGVEARTRGDLVARSLTLGAGSALDAGGDASLSQVEADARLAVQADADLSLADVTADELEARAGLSAMLEGLRVESATVVAERRLEASDVEAGALRLDAGRRLALRRIAAETLAAEAGRALEATRLQAGAATLTAGGRLEAARLTAEELQATSGARMTVSDLAHGRASLASGAALSLTRAAGGALDASAEGATRLTDVAATRLDAQTNGELSVRRVVAEALTLAGEQLALVDVSSRGDLAATAAKGLSAERIAAGGAADLAAGEAASVNRASVGGRLTATAGLDGDAALRLRAVEARGLDAEAGGRLELDGVTAANGATLRSRRGDVRLGALQVGGALSVTADRGAIRTQAGTPGVEAWRVAEPVAPDAPRPPMVAVADAAAASEADHAAPGPVAARTYGDLVRVDGDAVFDAAGSVLLAAEPGGRGNDFRGGVSVTRARHAAISDRNDLRIGGGRAGEPGLYNRVTGETLATVHLEAGGDILDGRAARIETSGDLRASAGGDVALDSGLHAIGGAVAVSGRDVSVATAGDLRLGPVKASGAARFLAGAGGERVAAITQARTVRVTRLGMENGLAADGMVGFSGPIRVDGAADFATGRDASLVATDAGADLVLDDPANVFGGEVSIRRIFGDVTLVEETAPGSLHVDAHDRGWLRFGAFEAGGDVLIRTSDDVVFLGRLTALTDAMDPDGPLAPMDRAGQGHWRAQGAGDIAREDLRLFLPDGTVFTVDATAGGADPAGGDVRFDRPVDGANRLSSARDAEAAAGRLGAGALVLNAGAGGDVRFRDYVGAANPIGPATVQDARNVSLGHTFALRDARPDDDPDRFLLRGLGRSVDVFTSGPIEIDARGTVEIHMPAGLLEEYEAQDDYFGLNTPALTYGDRIRPESLSLFGYIGDSARKAAGLYPVGPRGVDFLLNGCVIGDVQDCTGVGPPRVLTIVAIDQPEILNVDEEDLLEVFVSYGNEELWGVPDGYFADAELDRARQELNAEEDDEDEDEDEDEAPRAAGDDR